MISYLRFISRILSKRMPTTVGLTRSLLTIDSRHNYNDVTMSAMASQITSLSIVYSTVYSRRRSKKTSQLRITGLCAGNSPMNSPHKEPVTQKIFPFDDVVMMSGPDGKRISSKLWWFRCLACQRRSSQWMWNMKLQIFTYSVSREE